MRPGAAAAMYASRPEPNSLSIVAISRQMNATGDFNAGSSIDPLNLNW
jgi:hypothetical protein